MNQTLILTGLFVAALLCLIVVIFAIRHRRSAVTPEPPAPVIVIPLYDVEEEVRRARGRAYAEKMGNMHGHWGGAAGQPYRQ